MYDRIFIKPLPRCLLSHKFWEYLLKDLFPLGSQRDSVCKSALGFLRSYHYPIRHKSDFAIACREETRLLPEEIIWTQFCSLSSCFKDTPDSQVSTRYIYGELRLTRLNFYAKIFLGKFQYEQLYGQYGDYFSRFYALVLFGLAIWSLILNAMQT